MTTEAPRLQRAGEVAFDFNGARNIDAVIANLSGVAVADGAAWTVSDEGRTLESFASTDAGFILKKQFSLDDLFAGLPGGKEADLEAIDVAEGRVWLCGSHCRVRRMPDKSGALNPSFRRRPSRHLLGSVPLDAEGWPLAGAAEALPFIGENSLRRRLRQDPYLSAFINLPSKENGLDIEGVAVLRKRLLLGLRGPVIDSHAVVVSLPRRRALPTQDGEHRLHLLDLKGLGVRDLARDGESVLVLAGPVTATDGPFRVYRWRPSPDRAAEAATLIHEWPLSAEHPEGLCPFARDGQAGLLVVYDSPDAGRRSGTRVIADWFVLPP